MESPVSVLHEFLIRQTQVNCLLFKKGKQSYKDHLWLLRALTMHLHSHSNIDAHASQSFTEVISKSDMNSKNFSGKAFDDLTPWSAYSFSILTFKKKIWLPCEKRFPSYCSATTSGKRTGSETRKPSDTVVAFNKLDLTAKFINALRYLFWVLFSAIFSPERVHWWLPILLCTRKQYPNWEVAFIVY